MTSKLERLLAEMPLTFTLTMWGESRMVVHSVEPGRPDIVTEIEDDTS